MQFPGFNFASFTIPTGATTGARIVLDGVSGHILIYNSSNQLVDDIGGPSGAINVFGSTTSIEIVNGQILFGTGDITTQVPSALESTGVGSISLLSGSNAGAPANFQAELTLNQAVNPGGRPSAILDEKVAAAPTDFGISGAIRSTTLGGVFNTWQNPSYAANWAGGTSFSVFGGGQALRFRKTGEDEVWLYGVAVSSAGATTTMMTLPSGYFSASNTLWGSAIRNSGGTLTIEPIAISTAGLVIVQPTPVAGDQWLFNFFSPLGNIT